MRVAPFLYDWISDYGLNHTTKESLLGNNYGVEYKDVQHDIEVDVCVITIFKSGDREIRHKTITLYKGSKGKITGDLIPEGFLTHPVYLHPTYIELLVTPRGCYSFKWRIQIEN